MTTQTTLKKEIYEAILIASGFAKLNSAAIHASNGIRDLIFLIPSDIITEGEMESIKKSLGIINKIADNTGEHDAKHYISTGRK